MTIGTIRAFFEGVTDTARLMVGVPSYKTYLAHMEQQHPETRPMTYVEFFRNRQEAHFGADGKGGRSCC